ncbi:MAG: aminotransferase class III-fold pyridoxal phosphate-dependent enzyme [Dongiaceae bacterium]
MADDSSRNADLSAALSEAETRYVASNPKSRDRHDVAGNAMPGGNTRTVLHFDPFPLAWAKGEANRLTDLDGHVYADFLGEYTAGLYGHSDPVIQDAVRKALADGIVLGGPNGYEGQLAKAICDRFPSLDLVRFCNSGTEANLLAVQTARFMTKRDRVMVFEAGYHGSVFYFSHHGHPLNFPIDWVIGQYNEIEPTRAQIRKHARELAAILVEPMQGSGGCIPGDQAFLAMLREEATRHGIVLIFDEVMTSRLSPSGRQGSIGIAPDMTTLGKYLGGGLSFGAFGGRRDLMERFDPARPDAIGHAGTFNNNVLSMAAGLAGITKVFTNAEATRINELGERMRHRLNEIAAHHKAPMQATGIGSLLTVHFSDQPVRSPRDAQPHDPAREQVMGAARKLYHLDMMAAGQYMARRGFIALSLPMREKDIDRFLEATEEFLSTRGPVLRAAFDQLASTSPR